MEGGTPALESGRTVPPKQPQSSGTFLKAGKAIIIADLLLTAIIPSRAVLIYSKAKRMVVLLLGPANNSCTSNLSEISWLECNTHILLLWSLVISFVEIELRDRFCFSTLCNVFSARECQPVNQIEQILNCCRIVTLVCKLSV